jgi:hypothetical protein
VTQQKTSGETQNEMTENLDLDTGPKVAATPAAYNPTGSSIAPGSTVAPPGYPDNPAAFPKVNDAVAGGQPQDADTYSQGLVLMAVCPTCGIGYQPDQMGGHQQTHGSGFMREGSDFGNRNFSVDADLQAGRFSIGEQP